jgi:DNA-binding transcriptional ArsR family regulator
VSARNREERDASFRALADPPRRRMLDELAQGECTVGELCALFDTTQPAVSQRLKVLREAGLVRFRKRAALATTPSTRGPFQHVYDWSARYRHEWTKRLDQLGEVLARGAKKRS